LGRTTAANLVSWPLWVYVLLLFAALAALWPARTAALAGGADDVPDLHALERAFQNVVDHVAPSVVGIRARREYVTPVPGGTGSEQIVTLNGSGTILREDGVILTNQHVIQGAGEITVILHDGRRLSAAVIGADARCDLAILHVDADGLTPAPLCDWSTVARGQWNLAIGNPYGLGNDGQLSSSIGVIANLGRRLPGLGEVDDRLYADMIQTTAAIHPGNSGGPLFNVRGELIGVVTAVHTHGPDDVGVGFAIPLTPAKRRIIEQLMAGRPIQHGYLGLTVGALTTAQRTAVGIAGDVGVIVEQVEPGGPASQVGIQVSDVITHLSNHPIDAPMALAELVGQTPVGQEVTLSLRREGRTVRVQPRVEARQISRVAWMRSGAVIWRGMRVADLTADSRRMLQAGGDVAGVVIIDVQDASPAARARLRIGDVIQSVDDTPIGQTATFLQAVRGRHGAVHLTLRHRGDITVQP
jgi:serine protease Do